MNIFWQNFSPQNAVNGYVEGVLLTKLYPANYFAWAEMGYLTWCTEGCSWKKKILKYQYKKNSPNRKNDIRNINSTIKISSIASDRQVQYLFLWIQQEYRYEYIFLPGAYIIQSVLKKNCTLIFLSFAQKFVQVEAQLKGTLKGEKNSKKFCTMEIRKYT